MRIARIFFWLSLLAAVAVGLWFALRPSPLIVDTAAVTRGAMVVSVAGEGMAMAREIHIVSAPLSGRMERIEAEVGDAVVAGETALARIREAPPALLDERERKRAEARVKASRASLDLAKAERARAAAELANARLTESRLENLLARGAAPQQQLDEAATRAASLEAGLRRADAEIRLREHEIELSLAALSPASDAAGVCCVTVRAPASGRVLRVLHESEGVVAAGEALLEIADTEALEAVIELLSTEAVLVRPGAAAVIEAWGGGVKLDGKVRLVEPFAYTKVSALGVEEQRVRVIVDFIGEEQSARAARAALGHGYRVAAKIAVWRGDDVVQAPVSALFRESGGWAAFAVAADDAAELRALEVGRMNDERAQILGGLNPGETIIRYPPGRLKDGDSIIPR